MKKIMALRAKEKRYFVRAEDHLYVVVQPSGEKSWVFRMMKNGRAVKKTLGRVDVMDLYAARAMRDELLRESEPVKDTIGGTFSDLAEEWLERICTPKVTPKRVAKQESRLRRYVLPEIGNLVPREIKPLEILAILRGIESAGYTDLSHDVAGLVSMILRYGVSVGVVERDCVADLRGALKPHKAQRRATLTRHEDIAALMRALDTLPEGPVKWGVFLCAYTLLRSSEVRCGTWREIDFERAEWKIPAERMKMRRPHIVPLSRQALALLRKAKIYASGSPFILPALRGGGQRPLSDMAFLAALRRVGYERGMMSIHGFRSMGSTVLNEHGWGADAIERQLAHIQRDVRDVYNYAQYLPERREMLQWYADFLDALKENKN